MPLTRSALREKGITEREILDFIMDEHGNTLEAAKEKAKEVAESSAQKKIDALQAKIDAMPEPSASGDELQAKLDAMQAKYDADIASKDQELSDAKAAHEAEKATSAKQSILRKQLEADGANPKLLDLLALKFDLSAIELDGGTIKGWDTISKPIKEQYAEVFGKVSTQGADVGTPPGGRGATAYTADQIKNMTPAQINENWDKGVKQALEKGK